MASYRFRVFDGRHDITPDDVDLPDLAAARREGIRRAGAALVLDAHIITPENNWRMDVTDDRDTLLFRFDFAMTVAPAARGEGER